MFDVWQLLAVGGIGLIAGVLGGMLGIGGSAIMIPGLAILFGLERTPGMNQHLYQASAMIANIAVSVPAAMRHARAKAIVPQALRYMIPAALVFVLLGVWLSNLPVFEGTANGKRLAQILGAFLAYEVVLNVIRLIRGQEVHTQIKATHVTGPRSSAVGAMMGTIGGLLGIGGGALAVPMQQLIMHLPLRNAIANSSTIICVSSLVGAIYKNATLSQHFPDGTPAGTAALTSLTVAMALAPTAWVGGRLGASLTHRLPIRQVRIGFVILMAFAAWKMMGIPALWHWF